MLRGSQWWSSLLLILNVIHTRSNWLLTMSWTVVPRIYTNLQSSPTPRIFNNSRPIYVIFWEMRNHYRTIWYLKNPKCQHFLFLKKTAPKIDKFFIFYLIFKGSPFQYYKVRHPNFLQYTTCWNIFFYFSWKRIASS